MKLFVFGLGYTADCIASDQVARGAEVTATVRSAAKAKSLSRTGVTVRVFSQNHRDPDIIVDIENSEALLVSIPPSPSDPVLDAYAGVIASAPRLRWAGYLSTIGVYGDHQGRWVDERTPATPTSGRSLDRLEAERRWLSLGEASQKPVHIFRLAGIYGPGRNQLVQLAEGAARRIVKPNQVFNRVHVQDIARAVNASMKQPRAGAIYNVTDNEPAPPQDVVLFAASLLGQAPPPETPIENAALTPMASSFYQENKRVSNDLLRHELGIELQHPTYREGLTSLFKDGDGRR